MNLPTTHYEMEATAKSAPSPEAKTGIFSSAHSLLKTISFYILLAVVFLTPLIFIPSAYAPLDLVKASFLSLSILFAAILYVVSGLKNPVIVLPRSAFGYAALGIVVSIIISALQSTNLSKSFLGQGFELGSASFLLVMILASFLLSRMVLKDGEMVFKIYTVLFASFVVLTLFHIARIIGGNQFLTLNILNNLTASIAGKWYDFALISATVGLLSLISLKFLPLRKALKGILMASLVISGAILFIVNATFIWVLIAIVTGAIGVYEFSIRSPKGDGTRAFFSRISILTLIVFIAAVVFAWKGDTLAAPVMKSLKVEYFEAVLPWQLTLDITSNTLKESPFFGAGPNRFVSQYLRFKPLEVNQTALWNAEFASGFGVIPTFATTQGIVGIVLWCLFFFFFIREGILALRRVKEPLARFFLSSSFFLAIFLWAASFIYVPTHATFFLAFVFTGLFLAVLVREGFVKEKEVPASLVNRYGKAVLALFSIGAIVLVVWFGVYAKKVVALTYFQKGIKELNVNKSLENAEKKFRRALVWDNSDVYYQALSEINILKINALGRELQAQASGNSQTAVDQKKADEVVSLITESLGYTKIAEKIDPTNHYNYIAEARISEIGASLKIPNAYENAKAAYINALKVNPYNPAIYLALARLEAGQNKLIDAQQYVGAALQLKPNFIEAVFLLSQLQVANNQLRDALISTKIAIQLTPNEPLPYFQLGLLEYNDKNYTAAIEALEKAVTLFDQYANARYFLGLSYARLGNNEKAIDQFAKLAASHPDNEEVAFILSNLEQGRSPFADAEPPIDSKPENRQTLPVTEKNGKKVL